MNRENNTVIILFLMTFFFITSASQAFADSLDDLVRKRSSTDVVTAKKAAAEIAKNPEAIDRLSRMMEKGEPSWVRKWAATVLGDTGDPRAVEPLIRAMEKRPIIYEDYLSVQGFATHALGEIGGERAVDVLLQKLKDKELRKAVIRALGSTGDQRAVGPLIKALAEGRTRGIAATSLAKIGGSQAMEALAPLVNDENKDVREDIVGALAYSNDPRAIGLLIESLNDNEYHVRGIAARSLGMLGDKNAIEHLMKLLNDPEHYVRKKAKEALAKLNVSEADIKLFAMHDRKSLSQLMKKLSGFPGDFSMRKEVVELALKLEPPPTIPEKAIQQMARGQEAMKLASQPADYQEAREFFKEAVNIAPWWADPYFNLGIVYEKEQEFISAKLAFEYYLMSKPNATDAAAVQEKIYKLEYLKERKEKAGEHIRSAVQYFDSKHYNGTVREAREAIRLDPNSGDAHGWLGLAYSFQKKHKEAIVEMTEALRLGFDPHSSLYNWIGFYTNLGVSYGRLGDREKAISILEEGLDKAYRGNPGVAYFNLGHYYHQERRYEEAINNYQMALRQGYTDKAKVEKRINQCKRNQR